MQDQIQKHVEWLESQPGYANTIEFIRQLSDESPRGAVLVSGAELDRLLKECLISLLDKSEGAKKLFNGATAPLGTFSARIDAANALEIITDTECADLHIIRKIRNDFAHQLDVNFDTESVRDRCKNFDSALEANSASQNFEDTVMHLYLELEAALHGCKAHQLTAVSRTYGP